MKVLVVIANYGRKNDRYLSRLLSEYRGMTYQVDVVVLSNLKKDWGSHIEVVTGLPDRDPWSLPFGHKQIFVDRQDAYDLFVYSEDDMLITQRNIEAFMRVSDILPPHELVGFFQWERYPDGRRYYPAVHDHFHWIPWSVKAVGEYTFARFTSDHSACYLLSRSQLKRAIASGGFLVGPHERKYDLLVTAGTDPYTQCGFTKLLCVSHFEDFLVAHLPNRYIGTRMGSDASEFDKQIETLLSLSKDGKRRASLLNAETRLFHCQWSKDYYEPCREDMLTFFSTNTRCVLSIGTGWGATEAAMVRNGVRVVGIPLDPVIAACAESRGVEIIYGDLDHAFAQLAGRQFDGVLMSNVLHLLPDPLKVFQDANSLLAEDGVLVASLPNLARLPFIWRRLRYPSRYKGIGDYQLTGIHAIARRTARAWFQASGLKIVKIADVVPPNWKRTVALSGGLASPLFSSEYMVVGRKAGLQGNGRSSRHRRFKSHRLSTPRKGPNQIVQGTKV
jgi:SAM-dependent methyltransferase